MELFLRIIAIIACILLLIQVIYGIVRHYQGGLQLSRERTIANWIILVVMLLSWGGSRWLEHHPSHTTAHVRIHQTAKISHHRQTTQAKKQSTTTPKIGFNSQAKLDKNNQTIVKFTVPANARLQIFNSDNKVLLDVTNPANKTMSINFTFFTAGKYNIVGLRGQKKFTGQLNVAGQSQAGSNNTGTHIEYQRRLVPVN